MSSVEHVPQYRRAIVVKPADSTYTIRDNVPLPAPQSDEFIIRTNAIAINPSDLKMRGPFVVPDDILGIDCAGTVVSVGSNVTDLKPGDRVCGPQHSMYAHSPHYGALTDYAVCSGKVWMKVPEGISIEGAASLGAGISTAGLGIKLLGLPLPDAPISQEKKVYVLVYGGATATGTLAIQLLKLAGFVPIATCSPKSKELVTKCGAEATFDYRSSSCASDIKSYTGNNLRYALDCITTHDSTTCCLGAIGRAGGKYVSLDPVVPGAPTRSTVKTEWVLGPSIFGQGSTWPAPHGREPDDELRKFGEHLWKSVATLFREGKLEHHPLLILEGGLEKVLVGMELVAKGKLSGEKCVVRLSN